MPRDYTPFDSTRHGVIAWMEDPYMRHDQPLALLIRRDGSGARWQNGLASVPRGCIPHDREPCRSLQPLQCPVQGTTSKRTLLIGCPHSSQIPNRSWRIRVRASSMARDSLPFVCFKRICTAALISPPAMSTGSRPASQTAGTERTMLLPAESSCCFTRRRAC